MWTEIFIGLGVAAIGGVVGTGFRVAAQRLAIRRLPSSARRIANRLVRVLRAFQKALEGYFAYYGTPFEFEEKNGLISFNDYRRPDKIPPLPDQKTAREIREEVRRLKFELAEELTASMEKMPYKMRKKYAYSLRIVQDIPHASLGRFEPLSATVAISIDQMRKIGLYDRNTVLSGLKTIDVFFNYMRSNKVLEVLDQI